MSRLFMAMNWRSMMNRQKLASSADDQAYQLTGPERTALTRHVARRDTEPPAPRMKVAKRGGATKLAPDHPDPTIGYALLMEALGTPDIDFVNSLLDQLLAASSRGSEIDEARFNFMLAVIKEITPKDQVEAMLAAQMAVIHMTMMKFAAALSAAETLPQLDSTERAVNRLSRTYISQMEALKRNRTGGEQKVTVQNVSVGEGGQAIVGNVTQAGRASGAEKQRDEKRALTHGRQPTMEIIQNPAHEVVALRERKKDDGQSSA
jgi:hypothetical protein